MRYLYALGVMVLTAAFWNPGTSAAQQAPVASFVQDHDRDDRDRDRDRYDRHRVPEGSYRETCRDIRVDDGRLYARCRKRNNDWRNTSLNHYYRCRGEITNVNGRLECR